MISGMSKWLVAAFQKSGLATRFDSLVYQIVDRVEPELWATVTDRLPTLTYAEAKGYVWARSAPPVERSLDELAVHLKRTVRSQVTREARELIAERIVEQLKLYDQQEHVRSRAA